MEPRRSDANQKFQAQFNDLFGDGPETLGNESEIHTESAFNFNQEFHYGRLRTQFITKV